MPTTHSASAQQARRNHTTPHLEALEPRMLMAATLTGALDVVSRTTIAGWALNTAAGAAPVDIVITLDGQATTIAANGYRPDLRGGFGSSYHGFTFAMPALSPGTHSLLVEAVDPASKARATMVNMPITNAPPKGSLDVGSDALLAGWLFDPDAPNHSMQYRLDVAGVTGSVRLAAYRRTDLSSFLGGPDFGFVIPGNFAGKVWELYAIDAPTGQATLMFTNNRAPALGLDVVSSTRISGWVADTDSPATSLQVRVDVDGVAGTPITASGNRPDLIPAFGSAAHGFTVDLPNLTPGEHAVSIYATDQGPVGSPLRLIWSGTVTNAVPTGAINEITSKKIGGWAYDADLGSAPVDVTVYVDDLLYVTVTANQPRPDLVQALGSANHGWSVDLTPLPAGSHSITVTLRDDRPSSGSEVVLYDDFINNNLPVGHLDIATAAFVAGWAYDPDSGADSTSVDIYINDVYAGTVQANLSRPDLQSFIGSTNHGYYFALPKGVPLGTHKIEVYAAESQGNVSSRIGTAYVTNTAPIGSVDIVSPTLVAGWAWDKDAPTGSLTIKVMIDGVVAATATASANRPDLGPWLGTSALGYYIALPALASGSREISVLALDALSASPVTLATRVIVV